ncbi:glycoside hydrolase family 79 protein [Dothistroma septosporum NZE10]|uniref:Glycoside hydrolase family 79 protein n=1 Tax=Dothistroma septosporum (strain NZE10 / CBS 128990) TaxID=675120 RepID=N1PUY7_DOTSN|nr:glycoside hydrolase family 79 protein [Dothistroma septosporum NZE10]
MHNTSCLAQLAMWSSLLLLPVGATLTYQSPLLQQRQSPAFTISVSQDAPSGASDIVDKSFPAFAMSGHSFQEYTGTKANPNVFSRNLLDSISNRTGKPVHIRVGGTSADFANYDPSQTQPIVFPPGYIQGDIPKNMTLGPSWFEGFGNFPNVRWTFMSKLANYGRGQSAADTVAVVQQALQNIPSGHLDALEVGNEIGYYPCANRDCGYNMPAYISEWTAVSNAIDAAVGAQKYQAPVFNGNGGIWTIGNAFRQGQNSKSNVITASIHHYMDDSPVAVSQLQSNYMNHTRIAKQLSQYSAPVTYLKTNQTNVKLHLAEDNSNTYSKDNYDVLGVFGSTLWLVDYMLFASTLNVARHNIQQSTGFSYASWRGVAYNGLPAAVLPPWYAHPFVADVLGNTNDVRIADLKLGRDIFSGYGVYNAATGKLQKIVLINLEDYATSQGTRPSQSVTLNTNNANYNDDVRVDKLTAPDAHTQDASKITWKGTTWSFASQGKPVQGTSDTTTVRASKGQFTVTVPAAQAVLLTLT